MTEGVRPPGMALDLVADVERIIRRVPELRPITLTQSSAWVLASIGNDAVTEVAQRTVVPQQRGFIFGRSMSGFVFEIDGGRCRSTTRSWARCRRSFCTTSRRRPRACRIHGFSLCSASMGSTRGSFASFRCSKRASTLAYSTTERVTPASE